MKKLLKRVIVGLAVTLAFVTSSKVMASAATEYVSTTEFNKMLQKAVGSKEDFSKDIPCKTGVTWKDGYFVGKPVSDTISVENQQQIRVKNAVAMAGKAVLVKDKTTLNKVLPDSLFDYDATPWMGNKCIATYYYKRIKDLAKADEKLQSCIVVAYSKGIFVGKKSTDFTTTREFGMDSKLTKAQATEICNKIKTSSKRAKLSGNMQVCRTTKLPKNAKYFDYVLDTFPNYYYDQKAVNQLVHYPVAPFGSKHVYTPKDFTKGLSKKSTWFGMNRKIDGDFAKELDWMKQVDLADYVCRLAEENVYLTLSYNYKNTAKWKKDLAETYESTFSDGAKENASIAKAINILSNNMAAKKMILECKYTVADSHSFYQDNLGQSYVRVAAKFRFKSGTAKLKGDMYWIPTIDSTKEGKFAEGKLIDKKYGEWIDVIVDVPVALYIRMGAIGEDSRILPYSIYDVISAKKQPTTTN